MNRLSIMKAAVLEAGEFMLGAKDQTESETKANANDFVTVADIKSQNMIRKHLIGFYPDTLIISEEDSEDDRQKLLDPDFTGFVLDPIDGTYNFKRDMRESAISIGYIESGQSIAGVIYDPYRKELYEAEKGHGARCNDGPIQVSSQIELAGSSIATSNGYDYEAAKRNLLREIAIYETTGIMPWISCPGSAVLTLAWVACGRVDAIHHTGFKPFDNAAAIIINREAGARVLTLDGREATFIDDKLLVGTPAIVDQLQAVFDQLSLKLLS